MNGASCSRTYMLNNHCPSGVATPESRRPAMACVPSLLSTTMMNEMTYASSLDVQLHGGLGRCDMEDLNHGCGGTFTRARATTARSTSPPGWPGAILRRGCASACYRRDP